MMDEEATLATKFNDELLMPIEKELEMFDMGKLIRVARFVPLGL